MRFPSPRACIAGAAAAGAIAWALQACAVDHSGEPALLTVNVDSGATRFGKLVVILVDSLGPDTLWSDSLKDASLLAHLSTERYRGGKATLVIEGYKAGAKVYEEKREFDGARPAATRRDTVQDAATPISAFRWSQREMFLPFGDSTQWDTLRILPAKADHRVSITIGNPSLLALRDSSAVAGGTRFRLAALASGQTWIRAVSIAEPTLMDSVSVQISNGTVTIPVPQNLTARWQNTSLPRWTWKPGGIGGSTFYNVRLDDDALAGETVGDTAWVAKTPLADGPHTLYVRAQGTDRRLSLPEGMALIVDTEAPAAPEVANAALSASDNPRPSWTWIRKGGGIGRFRVKLDDSLLANGATGATAVDSLKFTAPDSLPTGKHTLYVQETDSAGNWSKSGYATVSVVAADRIPPDPPYRLSVYYGVVEKFTWMSRGGGGGVYRYLVDKSDFTKNTPTETPNPWYIPGADLDTANVSHKLYVQERDSVGNWSASAEFTFAAYHFSHIRTWADTNLVLAVAPDSLNVIVEQRILAPKNAAEVEAQRRQLWRLEKQAGVAAPWFKWTNLFLNAQLEHRGYGKQLQVEGFSPAQVDSSKFWRTEQIGFTGGAGPDKHFMISIGSDSYANVGGDVWVPGKAVILWEYSDARPNELWRFSTYMDKWFMQ